MRRVLAVALLVAGLGLAAGAAVAPKAGAAGHAAAFRGKSPISAGEPYQPVSPVDPQPQPQPIWIIRFPF